MNVNSLLHRHKSDATARLRLVCFSYAGGNADYFSRWQADLHPETELVVCHLPGHGVHPQQQPYEDISCLIADLSTAIATLADKPMVFFGHGMGAKLAYELCLAMSKRALPLPLHTVISAASPPFHRRETNPVHNLSDAEFIAALTSRACTPAQLLRDAKCLPLCLPTLRADFRMLETYLNTSRQKIGSQLTLLGGADDNVVSARVLSGWCQLFDRVIEAFWFDGGHFYLHEKSQDVVQFLNESVLEFNLRRMDQRRPYFEVAV